MKTPTLIVRLIGIYLVVTCSIGLLQLHNMASFGGQAFAMNPVLASFPVYCWIGLVVGVATTLFAGLLARLLTFDSELGSKTTDFSDRFMSK